MALELYIGFAKYQNKYFVNRQGKRDMCSNASTTFEDVNILLRHLTTGYGKRKASVIGISEDIQPDIKERIENHIIRRVKKLELRLSE